MHGMKEIFCIGLGAGASPFAGWQQTIASQPWNNIARNFSSQLHDTTQCSIHHLLQWSRDIVIFQVFSWCCCCCSGAFVLYLNLIHFLQNQDGKLSVKNCLKLNKILHHFLPLVQTKIQDLPFPKPIRSTCYSSQW